MVRGQHKSNTMAKKFVRTPGGKTVVRRVLRKPSRAKCPATGVFLAGIPHTRKSLSKSKSRPERPFGGVLSSSAARREIVMRARMTE